jgi:hypothetical protein
MCRNPKCRSKLPLPVSNPREAFCARGCHGAFYRKRCLVCEEPMERKTGNQLICGKRKCRNALQAQFMHSNRQSWRQKPLILLGSNRPSQPPEASIGPSLSTAPAFERRAGCLLLYLVVCRCCHE